MQYSNQQATQLHILTGESHGVSIQLVSLIKLGRWEVARVEYSCNDPRWCWTQSLSGTSHSVGDSAFVSFKHVLVRWNIVDLTAPWRMEYALTLSGETDMMQERLKVLREAYFAYINAFKQPHSVQEVWHLLGVEVLPNYKSWLPCENLLSVWIV